MKEFVFDAWMGHTKAQLKDDCRRLNRECGKLTNLLAAAVCAVPGLYNGIPEPARSEIRRRLSHMETDEVRRVMGEPLEDETPTPARAQDEGRTTAPYQGDRG